jgi:hypothetical protein
MAGESILSAAVPIMLDGRPYELRYHAHAFIRYAEECGGDLLRDLRSLGEGFKEMRDDSAVSLAPLLVKVRDLLWAGLIEAHPDVKREDVARMFGFNDMNTLAPAMMQALTRTLPEAPKTPDRPIEATIRRDLRPNGGLDSGPSSAIAAASAPENFML